VSKSTTGATRCDFCRKPRRELAHLIQGPSGACICDECIEIAAHMALTEFKKVGKREAPEKTCEIVAKAS
jgi:ATP-dependent protease Clp ATPase subunit